MTTTGARFTFSHHSVQGFTGQRSPASLSLAFAAKESDSSLLQAIALIISPYFALIRPVSSWPSLSLAAAELAN